MKPLQRCCGVLVLLGSFSLVGHSAAAEGLKTVSIGTATVSGTWYPTGGYICDLVNKTREQYHHNLHCTVQSTGGTVVNIRGLKNGDMEIGFAVTALQAAAYDGTGQFEGKPDKELRFVMSLYPQAFHLIVRKDSGVKQFGDLKGKRVSSGTPGTSDRATAEQLMTYFGINRDRDLVDVPLAFREVAGALCDNKIDAILFDSGVPTPLMQEAANTCGAQLAPIQGKPLDKFIQDHPYFSSITIPAGTYAQTDHDVTTFGDRTTLLSSSKVPPDAIYNLVRAVFDNFEELKQQNPVYKLMTRQASATEGRIDLPYHEGAKRYYEEKSLLK